MPEEKRISQLANARRRPHVHVQSDRSRPHDFYNFFGEICKRFELRRGKTPTTSASVFSVILSSIDPRFICFRVHEIRANQQTRVECAQ